jgi:hypothetical protein
MKIRVLHCLHPPIDFVAQSTNRSPLGFEAQTKKTSRWFWGPNHQTVPTSFEVQTEKPEATGYDAKPRETVTTSFEAKPGETVPVVFRPNHSQTVDLGFGAQPRNPPSSSPCAWYRSHTASPDLPIARPSITRLCLTIPGPLHQVFYSCHNPHRCPPCHTCHLYTMRQANAILYMDKDKGKTTKMTQIRIQTSTSQWHITNQTKVLITWFLRFAGWNPSFSHLYRVGPILRCWGPIGIFRGAGRAQSAYLGFCTAIVYCEPGLIINILYIEYVYYIISVCGGTG